MPNATDQQYLTQDQYKRSSNLDARIAIHKPFSTNPYGWFNWIFDALEKLPAEANVLELGCGAGTMWQECAERIPMGWVITLSDISDGMLDATWRNLIDLKRGLKFEKIDAQEIPYPDKTFDIVIANHMLYHASDRKKALREIKRILKPGGCLVATTVGENHMRELDDWVARITGGDTHNFPQTFTLENGTDQLREFFKDVKLLRYEDNLHVTKIEPILAYIKSFVSKQNIAQNELKNIEQELSAVLEKDGKIFIQKDSGLFLCNTA